MSPVDIYKHLQQDVIGQEETLKYVSVAIFKHLQGERYGNLFLIGNSGTGKTTIMRAMERLYEITGDFAHFRVVVILNSNTLATDDGAVDTHRILVLLEERARQILGEGASAEEIGRYMQHATVCLDEIDKVSGILGGRAYVTGLNIQQALLTMIEGEKILHPITAIVDKVPERKVVTIDTGMMLFLCAGAFESLYDQVYQRVIKSRVKLPTETIYKNGEVQIREYFTLQHHFRQEDLFDYGMQPQFMSRFDNAIILEDLNPGALSRIFMEPQDAVFRASQKFFRNYSIELEISEGAVRKIAEEASKSRRTGGRALKAVFSKIIKPFEFDPFSQPQVNKGADGFRLVIDEALVARSLKLPLETIR